ncbi:MAG TPA: threonine synthase [Candidatus Paceibacterota bacterium]
MRFHSTNGKSRAGFSEALRLGLAPDGGLFMPDIWPHVSATFLRKLPKKHFHEIALALFKLFVSEIPERELKKITREAFDFPVPLIRLEENLFVLELFHGPTMAFKDFGARFLSRTLSYFLRKEKDRGTLNIIVATSGDTGSAVASGFFNVPGIRVFILYPSGLVSRLQEQQLTTYGKNIIALEVKGTFDDCQRLAKQALSDKSLNAEMRFSSANSINFGRLLPQASYYAYAAALLQRGGFKKKPTFIVPSGNFGNLFAGLIAKKAGFPIARFVAATNANSVVPEYLQTGKFAPRKSKKTISNAMDVGNPSNFVRILEFYRGSRKAMAKDILGMSISDAETRATIRDVFCGSGYVLDPHTAVGVAAARKLPGSEGPVVILGTAHPAKFREVVEPVIGKELPLPKQLQAPMKKKKRSVVIRPRFPDLVHALRRL